MSPSKAEKSYSGKKNKVERCDKSGDTKTLTIDTSDTRQDIGFAFFLCIQKSFYTRRKE